jgi:hypothetical protein
MFGGPVYFIGKLVYNVPFGGALKTGGANPAGVLVYHNTFIAENSTATGYSNVHFRNNLFIGTDRPNRNVFRMESYTSYSTSDYNGFRINQTDKPSFRWGMPTDKLRQYDPKPEATEFKTLEEYSKASGQDAHSELVELDIFKEMKLPDPNNPHKVYLPQTIDFHLKANTSAVDKGIPLANVNDGFSGAAPDLGALELGAPDQVYGPRTP